MFSLFLESFCMQVTSRRSTFCNEHLYGGAILLNVNNELKAVIPRYSTRYEFCLPTEDVDVTNDRFQLQATNNDGVCISSFQVNGTQIFVGPENNQTSFWIAQNQPSCDKQKVATNEITVQNGQVVSSECKGM